MFVILCLTRAPDSSKLVEDLNKVLNDNFAHTLWKPATP